MTYVRRVRRINDGNDYVEGERCNMFLGRVTSRRLTVLTSRRGMATGLVLACTAYRGAMSTVLNVRPAAVRVSFQTLYAICYDRRRVQVRAFANVRNYFL